MKDTTLQCPALCVFSSPEQAAGYFMLGETSKTSAAGKERGKTRSPFTQPFFPAKHGLQAKRFAELAATMSHVNMWLMNTGYIGGDSQGVKTGSALKVRIQHSSAMLEALLSDSIKWKRDSDFGYEIVGRRCTRKTPVLSKKCPRRFWNLDGSLKTRGVSKNTRRGLMK